MREIPMWVLYPLLIIMGGLFVIVFVGPGADLFSGYGEFFRKPLHSCTFGDVFLAGISLVMMNSLLRRK